MTGENSIAIRLFLVFVLKIELEIFYRSKVTESLKKRLIRVDKVTEKLEPWQLHSIKFNKISK